jgi:hypothetical protein
MTPTVGAAGPVEAQPPKARAKALTAMSEVENFIMGSPLKESNDNVS